jgi:hypothetical protein
MGLQCHSPRPGSNRPQAARSLQGPQQGYVFEFKPLLRRCTLLLVSSKDEQAAPACGAFGLQQHWLRAPMGQLGLAKTSSMHFVAEQSQHAGGLSPGAATNASRTFTRASDGTSSMGLVAASSSASPAPSSPMQYFVTACAAVRSSSFWQMRASADAPPYVRGPLHRHSCYECAAGDASGSHGHLEAATRVTQACRFGSEHDRRPVATEVCCHRQCTRARGLPARCAAAAAATTQSGCTYLVSTFCKQTVSASTRLSIMLSHEAPVCCHGMSCMQHVSGTSAAGCVRCRGSP